MVIWHKITLIVTNELNMSPKILVKLYNEANLDVLDISKCKNITKKWKNYKTKSKITKRNQVITNTNQKLQKI